VRQLKVSQKYKKRLGDRRRRGGNNRGKVCSCQMSHLNEVISSFLRKE